MTADDVADTGLHTAMFLTLPHDRVLPAGLAQVTTTAPRGKLRTAATAYQAAIDDFLRDTGLAALKPDPSHHELDFIKPTSPDLAPLVGSVRFPV